MFSKSDRIEQIRRYQHDSPFPASGVANLGFPISSFLLSHLPFTHIVPFDGLVSLLPQCEHADPICMPQ
jgi:hypothetical protein